MTCSTVIDTTTVEATLPVSWSVGRCSSSSTRARPRFCRQSSASQSGLRLGACSAVAAKSPAATDPSARSPAGCWPSASVASAVELRWLRRGEVIDWTTLRSTWAAPVGTTNSPLVVPSGRSYIVREDAAYARRSWSTSWSSWCWATSAALRSAAPIATRPALRRRPGGRRLASRTIACSTLTRSGSERVSGSLAIVSATMPALVRETSPAPKAALVAGRFSSRAVARATSQDAPPPLALVRVATQAEVEAAPLRRRTSWRSALATSASLVASMRRMTRSISCTSAPETVWDSSATSEASRSTPRSSHAKRLRTWPAAAGRVPGRWSRWATLLMPSSYSNICSSQAMCRFTFGRELTWACRGGS